MRNWSCKTQVVSQNVKSDSDSKKSFPKLLPKITSVSSSNKKFLD